MGKDVMVENAEGMQFLFRRCPGGGAMEEVLVADGDGVVRFHLADRGWRVTATATDRFGRRLQSVKVDGQRMLAAAEAVLALEGGGWHVPGIGGCGGLDHGRAVGSAVDFIKAW